MKSVVVLLVVTCGFADCSFAVAPERQQLEEVVQIAQSRDFGKLAAKVKSYADNNDPPAKIIAGLAGLVRLFQDDPKANPASVVQESFRIAESKCTGDPNRTAQFFLLKAGFLASTGDNTGALAAVDAAAAEAAALSEGVRASIVAQKSKLLFISGQKAKAMEIVNEQLRQTPNSFRMNAAVRLGLAESFNDLGDSQGAYDLLAQLRSAFPIEFEEHVYAVQNYLDYAVNAPHDTIRGAQKQQFFAELALYAKRLVEQEPASFAQVAAPMHLTTGRLFHAALDAKNALSEYALATKLAADSTNAMGETVRRIAAKNTQSIKDGRMGDVVSRIYGREFAEWAKFTLDSEKDQTTRGISSLDTARPEERQAVSTAVTHDDTRPIGASRVSPRPGVVAMICAGVALLAGLGWWFLTHRRRSEA